MLPTPSPVLALVSVRRGIPLFTEKALRSKTSGNVMRCLVGWFVMAAILTTQTPIGLYLSAPSGFCCQAPIGCYSSTHRRNAAMQSSDRVIGSAVTAEFLQQARLGKHKAPAGGSGLEKIVGRSSQYCSAPGWDRQQEHQPATRKPPAGFCTAVRRDLYRQEKKPKAALRQPERSIRRAIHQSGISQASRAGVLEFNRR